MNSKIKIKHPIGFQWKIPKNKVTEKVQVDESLESNRFQISGTNIQYSLIIYPNGYNDKHRGKTLIFFRLRFEKPKLIEAKFSVSIDSANFTHKMEHVYTAPLGDGSCVMEILFDPAKRLIFDGEMIIKVEGFLMVEKDAPGTLCQLGNSGKLCINLWHQQNKDFTIVADGKEIQAHKLILTAHSPVFEAMFKPHTKEALENRVTIPDFSFNVAEAAIKFCYDSSLVGYISLEDQMSLLQFFDKYDMNSLKDDLEQHLSLGVDETNVCSITNCSIIYNATKLRRKCSEFLLACIKNGKTVSDFDLLDKDFAFELFKNSMLFSC